MGSLQYINMLKYNTLILQNAFEEGEDTNGLTPKDYYDMKKKLCKVGVGGKCSFLQKCKKSTNDASILLCDNCNDGYHMKCVRLKHIPDVPFLFYVNFLETLVL